MTCDDLILNLRSRSLNVVERSESEPTPNQPRSAAVFLAFISRVSLSLS